MPADVKIVMIGVMNHGGTVYARTGTYPGARLVGVSPAPGEEHLIGHMKEGGWLPSDARVWDYADYTTMLDELRPDVAGVCGPIGYHFNAIRACLERGIHVLAEKPLCSEPEEFDEIVALHARSGAKLNVLLDMRFQPVFARAKQLVDAGAIGEVGVAFGQKSYRAGERPKWYHSRRTYCGTIPYIGCHLIDMVRWLTGREFVSVSAYRRNVCHPQFGEMDDSAGIAFQLDNGACGSMTLDYLRPAAAPSHGDDRVRLAGSDGVIEVRGSQGEIIVIDRSGERTIRVQGEPASLLADFLSWVYDGAEPVLDPRTPFEVTRVCLAARRSAETGEVVRLR